MKTTFLHGKLEEVIYMDQPLGFVERKIRCVYLRGHFMVLNKVQGSGIKVLMIICSRLDLKEAILTVVFMSRRWRIL